MVLEIDISRAANLMLKGWDDQALEESVTRADDLAANGDYYGAAVWRRIAGAVARLANTTPSGQVH